MNRIATWLFAGAVLLSLGFTSDAAAQRRDDPGPVGVQQHDRDMTRGQDPNGNPNRDMERSFDRANECVAPCDDPARERAMEQVMNRLRQHAQETSGRFQDAVQAWQRFMRRIRTRVSDGS